MLYLLLAAVKNENVEQHHELANAGGSRHIQRLKIEWRHDFHYNSTLVYSQHFYFELLNRTLLKDKKQACLSRAANDHIQGIASTGKALRSLSWPSPIPTFKELRSAL